MSQKALQPKIDKLAEGGRRGRGRGRALPRPSQHLQGRHQQYRPQPAAARRDQRRADARRRPPAAKPRPAPSRCARWCVPATPRALPDVQKSPLIQNLVQQRVRVERQISELSATLLPAHPRMRQLRADLDGLQRQIKSEVGKIVEGIEKRPTSPPRAKHAVRKSLDADEDAGRRHRPRRGASCASSKPTPNRSAPSSTACRPGSRPTASRRQPRRAGRGADRLAWRARRACRASPSRCPTPLLVAMATLLFGIAIVITKALFIGARAPRRPRRMAAMTESRSRQRAASRRRAFAPRLRRRARSVASVGRPGASRSCAARRTSAASARS